MSASESRSAEREAEARERAEVRREATTMVLYVSVVLLAELSALPRGDDHGVIRGPVGWKLVAICWGTTVGLAVTHWFAFRLTAQGFGRGTFSRHDREVALGQIG
jgi:hypothetical protein